MPVIDPEFFMREALIEAEKAKKAGEVPVGAVIVVKNRIVARSHNQVERFHDATRHAEITAIRRASRVQRRWRLEDASLFVTLEPCSMCIGAILLSRLKELYFGCYDPKQGAVGSLYDLSNYPDLPRSLEVYPEVLDEDCHRLLWEFFSEQRQKRSIAEAMH